MYRRCKRDCIIQLRQAVLCIRPYGLPIAILLCLFFLWRTFPVLPEQSPELPQAKPGVSVWRIPNAPNETRESIVPEVTKPTSTGVTEIPPANEPWRAPKEIPWQELPWQSYISSYTSSRNEYVGDPVYDSRNVWVRGNQCSYESKKPPRPAFFESVIAETCANIPKKACDIFTKSFPDAFDNSAQWLPDDTVFLITGDIPCMWLRDSTAQLTPYLLRNFTDDKSIQQLIEGTLQRNMKWIEMDVYGSAFRMYMDDSGKGINNLSREQLNEGKTAHVAQHDYEIDSLAYFVRLAYKYWKKQPLRTCWMTQLSTTLRSIVDLWKLEQKHPTQSKYRYPTLRDTTGTPVCENGMTWGGMRPSDDPMTYHFNIPANLFASKALEQIEEFALYFNDNALREDAVKLRHDILDSVKKLGTTSDKRLAYEVDGCGKQLIADDANIPSLLSLPYLEIDTTPYNYAATRASILSTENPYYTHGSRVSGIGSDHWPYKGTKGRGHVWHLSLIMQGLTGDDTLEVILNTADNGSLHESVDANHAGYTREWFGWANALFSEWMMQISDSKKNGGTHVGLNGGV